jgi:hypothetical protein
VAGSLCSDKKGTRHQLLINYSVETMNKKTLVIGVIAVLAIVVAISMASVFTDNSTTTSSGASQPVVAKSGVEKACDPSKNSSLYDSAAMSLCVTTFNNIVAADRAAGMTEAQAEASASR